MGRLSLFTNWPRKLAIFAALGDGRRLLFVEAWLYLAYARIWLLISPFQKVAARLGVPRAPSGTTDDVSPPLSAKHQSVAERIAWAIGRASRNSPLRAVCLQQAVAGKLMLRRRSIASTLHFGVIKVGGTAGLRAHAWLHASNVKVSGYPMMADYQEIARFD